MIVNMKEEVSLDDMAKMFSADIEEEHMEIGKLIKNKVIDEAAMGLYKTIRGIGQIKEMKQIVSSKILSDEVVSGKITLEEGKILLNFIESHFSRLIGESARIYLFRNMGLPFVMESEDKR